MKKIFIKKAGPHTLVLLHGTGGKIDDLVNIANFIDENANLLLLEGDVLEYNQRRYFKRFLDGSYDLDDLDQRARKLDQLVSKTAVTEGFDLNMTTYIGYSNGANIILYQFLNLKPSVKRLISFHGMIKNMSFNKEKMTNINLFFTVGMYDPLTPYKSSIDSLRYFSDKGINVQKYVTHEGHNVTQNEIIEAKKWYNLLNQG